MLLLVASGAQVANIGNPNFPTIVETLVDAVGKPVQIQIRPRDCFVNVTEICRSYDKVW